MDEDRTSWTPGELPQPSAPAAPPWSAPSGTPAAPTGTPAPGSSYPPGAGAPAASPYAPPSGPPAAPYGQATYGVPASAAQPGYPTAPGYPPPGGYPPAGQPYGVPYGAAPFGGYPPAPPTPPGTDGFAIAALVFGILGGWLAFVFGPIALGRVKRSGRRGRGMAITGMCLAAAIILLEIGAAVAIPVFLNQRHEALHDQCAAGDMAACDRLFDTSADGSADQDFGNTCGGRTEGGYLCTSIGDETYGDDDHLDTLWDACAGGDGSACDELAWSAEPGSDYSQYGWTCGGITDGTVECTDALDQSSATT